MKVAKKKKASRRACPSYSGELSPTENKATTFLNTEKVAELLPYSPQVVYEQLCRALGINGNSGCSTAEQLRIFKKYVPCLINMYFVQGEALASAGKNEERLYSKTAERSNKRWDKDEDELLVDLVSEGRTSLTQIAISMGRTPAAIQTRLSYLVGIRKITQEIAGRFIGTLNGEDVSGYIDGTFQKAVS